MMHPYFLAYLLSLAAVVVAFGLRRRWLYGVVLAACYVLLTPFALVLGLPLPVLSSIYAVMAIAAFVGVFEWIIRLVDRLASSNQNEPKS